MEDTADGIKKWSDKLKDNLAGKNPKPATATGPDGSEVTFQIRIAEYSAPRAE